MIWTCEYSPTQGCFHIDTLQKVLEINRVAILRGANSGYVLLGLFETQRQAGDFAKQMEEELRLCRKE